MSKRIEYIDIARGIGILLVVLAHNDFALVSPLGHKVIYSFHMPLFFFLSGFFLNPSIPLFEFIKKRFNSVLKPYLFTIFLFYFFSVSFSKMSFETALTRIVKAMYGTAHYMDWEQLWFLPHLFALSIYAYLFLRLTVNWNRILRWGIMVSLLYIGYIFLRSFYPFSISILGKDYELFGLPYGIDLLLLSGFFFILGNEIRQNVPINLFGNVVLLVVTGAGLLLLNFYFVARVDMTARVYNSLLINTVEAVLGILFVLALSRQIEIRSRTFAKPLMYFGEISLIILIFHAAIQHFWSKNVLAMTGNAPLSIWIGFVAGVAGSVLIYELFIKANPVASFWFGRQAVLPEQKEVPSSNPN